jgi:long-chain acyl-CoA synthetase
MGDREGTSTTERRGTGAEHLAAMVVTAGEEYEGAALRYHDGDDWTELSYPELRDAAREIAGGLIALGLEARDRVAIFAETRMEWTLADLGAILAGIVVVPIYHTSSEEEAHHVLEDSGATLVFCEDEEKVKTITSASEDLSIDHLVVLEGEADGAMTLAELRERGKDQGVEVDRRIEGIAPDDTFTLV